MINSKCYDKCGLALKGEGEVKKRALDSICGRDLHTVSFIHFNPNKIGWLISVTTGGLSLTKRLAFLPSKSAAGG
jgi:hypothetical protein